jgi:hypothetical protein
VAFTRIDVRVTTRAVAGGRYLMVHLNPPMPMTGGAKPLNPGIACGDLVTG